MRPKRAYRVLSDVDVLDIVRGYHLRMETQASLAAKHGVDPASISRICNGAIHSWAYAQVATESAGTTAE
jgi:hypothetical protein